VWKNLMIYNTVFVSVYRTLHCKFAYLCIYDLFHILLSLWHTHVSMECMYIRMYDVLTHTHTHTHTRARVRVCACACVCVCVCKIKFLNTVSWTMDMCSFTCYETVNGNCLEVSAVQALHWMYQTQDEQIILDYPKT
jgi:hypothetical protein